MHLLIPGTWSLGCVEAAVVLSWLCWVLALWRLLLSVMRSSGDWLHVVLLLARGGVPGTTRAVAISSHWLAGNTVLVDACTEEAEGDAEEDPVKHSQYIDSCGDTKRMKTYQLMRPRARRTHKILL
jgi:hypothetical protein